MIKIKFSDEIYLNRKIITRELEEIVKMKTYFHYKFKNFFDVCQETVHEF